ncbi:PUA domain-containing protein [Thermoproteota archaeon]
MKSYMLTRKNGKEITDKIQQCWPNKPIFNPKKILSIKIDVEQDLLISKEFTAVKIEKDVLPFLKMEKLLEACGKIFVDKGAIRFICNGANVMRPGVLSVEGDFESDDIICVKEIQYSKFLAIGFALSNSSEIKESSKGIVMKNMHYIGDKFWEVFKSIR